MSLIAACSLPYFPGHWQNCWESRSIISVWWRVHVHTGMLWSSQSAPLLHSNETSPIVLHPALGCSAQEGHQHVGVSPGEWHRDDQRREHHFYEERLRESEIVQPRGEKILKWPSSDISVPKGSPWESWRGTSNKGVKTRDNGIKLTKANIN